MVYAWESRAAPDIVDGSAAGVNFCLNRKQYEIFTTKEIKSRCIEGARELVCGSGSGSGCSKSAGSQAVHKD